MMVYIRSRLFWVLGFIAFAADAHGQTLFARPDTTPDYASYRHIEECLIVGYKLTEEDWGKRLARKWDTMSVANRMENMDHPEEDDGESKPGRPESAVQATKACLGRFNPDTATYYKSAPIAYEILKALFMAYRWNDAERFASRLLDSMRVRSTTEYKNVLQKILEQYVRVRPIRSSEAKQFYTQLITAVTGDSLYRTIDAALTFSGYAKAVGDTALFKELRWYAVRTNDMTPAEERHRSPGARDRLVALSRIVQGNTEEEGFDSLAVSTLAYNLYRENTVRRRVTGEEPVTAADPVVQPYKVPSLLGAYYYTATTDVSPDSSNQRLTSYTREDSMPHGALPVKGRINWIARTESFCSTEEKTRVDDELLKRLNACTNVYAMVRRWKRLYPDLEIILLSYTYGTVGQLGPLHPTDEADTLAKLFLGHHRVPGHLVVEKTPFFHVEDPDGRRIDLPTALLEEFGPGRWGDVRYSGWFTDKDGYQIFLARPGDRSEGWFDRAYKILMNRPSK